MKIERRYDPIAVTIEFFAEENDLTMILERGHTGDRLFYTAHFADSFGVRRGCGVLGIRGTGPTEEAAIWDYARQISGRVLGMSPFGQREIQVPVLRRAE